MKSKSLLLSLFLSLAFWARGELKIASALGDNMVLQRNTEVRIWGKAAPGAAVTVRADWNKSKVQTTCNDRGEWLVRLKTTEAGGPYTIQVASGKESLKISNILLGEVWLCSGQSNMEMTVSGFTDQPVLQANDILVDADNDQIRLFSLKRQTMDTPQDTCVGRWMVSNASSAAQFSAVGYLYARQLQRKLKVPVGVICSSFGGSRIESWMSKEVMAGFPAALAETTKPNGHKHQSASYLYNGMISPLLNCVFKGAIWYQGESNVVNYKDYAALMSGMISGWRKDFGFGNFPFYFVQIAPCWYNNSKANNSAMQRDEQYKASLAIPNTGMASAIDLGDEFCIHPPDKETVAKRLSYWALSETYGFKGIAFKNPVYKSIEIKDTMAIVSFDNVMNGLNTFGRDNDNFEIAGADKVFYPAKVKITGRQARVWSPQVKNPVAVRYAFYNFPQGKGFLYNTAGLPVPSFRTDDW